MNDQDKLFAASKNNEYNTVKEILAKNPKLVNAEDILRFTPLHSAAMGGHLNIVELLVENGADVNAKSMIELTPLHSAAGHLNVVKFLLEKGADINGMTKHTPLHSVAMSGHLDVVKFLLEKGAGVNARDNDGNTPLHYAVLSGHTNVAELLIENGADVKAKNKDGNTPLHYAARGRNLEIVKFLIKNGADINAKDKDGKTPLQVALEMGRMDFAELIVNNIVQREAVGLRVDEQNLRLKSKYISSSQERNNSYLEHFRECKEEIAKITRESKSLINFLKAENFEESEEIWVENESVRNAFNDQERLKEQYPKYADMLIHKANEVKKEIFLHNHEPLIDPLLKLCERNFNNMTFHDMVAFCNNKDLAIDNLRLPLTNFIDFGDINAKHPASLKVQTFAKTVKISTAKTAEIYTIRIEKSKNAGTSLTDTHPKNVSQLVSQENSIQ